MNKKEFIDKYSIKNAKPIDPSLRVIPAEGFAQALEDFISERFRGVARACSTVKSYSGILISPEYVAMFFKTLLTDIYGRCFLEVTIDSDNDYLTILIDPSAPLPLTDSQLRNLIRLARNGGMRIAFEEEKIKLTTLFSEAAIRRVYAISVSDGRSIMLSKLSEIFYCGDEYPEEK